MLPSCALLGGFSVGERVSLLWQHSAALIGDRCIWQHSREREMSASRLHACTCSVPGLKMRRRDCHGISWMIDKWICSISFRERFTCSQLIVSLSTEWSLFRLPASFFRHSFTKLYVTLPWSSHVPTCQSTPSTTCVHCAVSYLATFLFFFLNITLSKQAILTIFAKWNPEKILHQQLIDLLISPVTCVSCSHFTLGNPESHFSTILFILMLS